MKIAITAASGQLGTSVVKELIREIGADQIIGIARTPDNAAHLGIEVRKGDYKDRETLNAAFEGVDRVLLISGNDQPEKRIGQHRNVIEAAKQNGVHKIVYTSIVGPEADTAFSPIVNSNRQTEADIKASGLDWVIGRNGIYIDPDLEYIDTYVKDGEIRNCAGNGKCGYTSRQALGVAYSQLLLNDKHNGNTYNLLGEPISQAELAALMNEVYGTNLKYAAVSVDEYANERKEELGDFLGNVIAGIYHGIARGVYDLPSDFKAATGKPHPSALELIKAYKAG